MVNNRVFHLILAAAFAVPTFSFAADTATEENADRIVDQASVDMQDEADRELSALARKYKGTEREADMQMRLAELRMEIAESLFRVEYGPGESSIKSAHTAKLASAIAPLSRILSAYPKSEAAPRALFLRGKAEKELGRNAAALTDLEAFLSKHSSREEAPLAAIGVADLSMDKQNYSRAITVLGLPASKPSHSLYPNALAKRAWALQANGNPQAAVQDLKTLASWLRARAQSGKLSAGDASLRESIQSDVPTIGYLAYTKNPKAFTLTAMNDLLRSFDTGEGYRRMAMRVTEHFRIADMNPELRAWKGIVLKSDPSRQANLPMLIGVLEYDLDREAYDDVAKTLVDVSAIVAETPAVAEADTARALAVKAIANLTKRLTDYRKTAKATDAEKWLAVIVPAFDRMATANDPRRFVIRWNLGETYFSLERYESAAQNYRWIATNWSDETVLPAALAKVCSKGSASLKAIAARYEGLRAAGLVPSRLEATASIAKPVRDAAKVAAVREWIGWIDAYSKETGSVIEEFEFEADRTLYSIGMQDEGMQRMQSFATRAPGLKVSVPAASLVVDTWIARKRWDKVEEESRAFASVCGWAKPGFSKDMAAQAASAKFKRAESAYAAKNWGEASKQASEYVKSYGKTEHAIDAAGIVCNSELGSGDVDGAVSCFSDFATTYAGTKASVEALKTAARLEDDRMHFAAAQELYTRYLHVSKKTLSANDSLSIRKRILMLARATGEASRMERPASSLCSPKLEAVCETNQALSALSRGTDERGVARAIRLARTARPELRSIWAMMALEAGWKTMEAKDLAYATGLVSSNWNRTEASARYLLIAKATKVFPAIVARDRDSLKTLKIDATEKSITRRLNALKSIEARSNAVAAVPVNAVKSAAIQSLFGSYNDLVADIRSIPVQDGAVPAQVAEHRRLVAALAEPFVIKSRKIRDAAASLALREEAGLDSDSIDSLWSEPMTSRTAAGTAGEALRKEWSKAISSGNWVRVAFLSDEAGARAGIPSGWAKAARAASLAEAGAASEAKIVLGDACRVSSESPALREACRSHVKVAAGKGRG
jgi:TolA-binding protein